MNQERPLNKKIKRGNRKIKKGFFMSTFMGEESVKKTTLKSLLVRLFSERRFTFIYLSTFFQISWVLNWAKYIHVS